MHVGTDGIDRGALPRIEARGQQSRQALFRPVFGQADHLAMHEIREHGVELLRLAAVNLVRSQIPGTSSRALTVPVAQERVLRAPGFPPTDAVADRRMRRRHRLTVHPDLLPQAPRDPRFRIGELDPFGTNAAVGPPYSALRIPQRDRIRPPRHIVPGSIACRSHPPRAASAAAASVAPDTAALDPDRQPAVYRLAVTLGRHRPKPRQAQNPRTIALRSHRSSLAVSTTRDDDTGWSSARGIALMVRSPSRSPTHQRSAQATGYPAGNTGPAPDS